MRAHLELCARPRRTVLTSGWDARPSELGSEGCPHRHRRLSQSQFETVDNVCHILSKTSRKATHGRDTARYVRYGSTGFPTQGKKALESIVPTRGACYPTTMLQGMAAACRTRLIELAGGKGDSDLGRGR